MTIVAISRGTFSGGRVLAERLADRMGYECLGREVVLDAARKYGIPIEKLTAEMEQPPSLWQRLNGYRARYLEYLRATLLDRAQNGKLVYHGHAGHLLLPGISHVLRVRVIADMGYRLKSAMEQQGFGRAEAAAYIGKMDAQRLRWIRFLYGVDGRDPSLYDVVINLERTSIEDACETVARMADLESFRPTAESLRAAEDLTVACRAWAVLASTPATAAAHLEVVADGGVVSITGRTHYPEVWKAIPTVAAGVEGVRAVRCSVQETSRTYP